MSDVAVLVPVLNRPHRADPLARSLRDTSDARLVFLATKGDHAEIVACRETAARYPDILVVVVPFPLAPGDYARKINHGVTVTDEPWLFQAGDDLRFHPGWMEAALAAGARGRVVGTNDLGNQRVRSGRHSTHSLVARSYVDEHGTIDRPGVMLSEAYRHNFVDDELVATARARREFVFARGSVVEHLHPNWSDGHGGRKGVRDETYARGEQGFAEDRALFRDRSRLWNRRRPGRR